MKGEKKVCCKVVVFDILRECYTSFFYFYPPSNVATLISHNMVSAILYNVKQVYIFLHDKKIISFFSSHFFFLWVLTPHCLLKKINK